MKETTITTTKYRKECPICKSKFTTTRVNKKYCSKVCAEIAKARQAQEREKTSACIETRKKYASSENRKISNKKYMASKKGKEVLRNI